MNEERYNVFHRTWWRLNMGWPQGREPGVGKRKYIARGVTYAIAREICADWNANHEPGLLSDKAEFENV